MDALYSFLTFLQPGILWPQLAIAKPMVIAGLIGFVAGLSRRRMEPLVATLRQPPFIWLLIFVFVQALSVYSTGFMGVIYQLLYWLNFVVFVVVSVSLINSVAALQRYVVGAISGAMVIIGYGIYAKYAGLLPAFQGGRAGAYGMYENQNDYSFAIIMILPFILFARRNATGHLARLVLLACALACVLGIFLSLSRGGVLALIAEVALFVLYGMKRRRVLLFIVLAFIGSAAISWQWHARAVNQGAGYTYKDSETTREELWRAGWAMFKANPILGVGSRSFGEHAPSYTEISHDNRNKNAHNTYIEVAATSGLTGILSFLLMLRSMHRELRNSRKITYSPELTNLRLACRIALYSITFRALFDAKPWDWSFYLFCAIVLASSMLERTKTTPRIAGMATLGPTG